MPALFWPLLLSLGLSMLWTLAFVWALDKNAAVRAATIRAKRPAPITIAPQPGRLPRCVAIPRAWRDGKWWS